MEELQKKAVNRVWNSISENWKTFFAVCVFVLCGFSYFLGNKFPLIQNLNVENNTGLTQTVQGNNAPVNQTQIVNKPAIYKWINENSWSSQPYDKNGKRGFSTELVFQSDGGLLGGQVCLDDRSMIDGALLEIIFKNSSLQRGLCSHPADHVILVDLITTFKPTKIQVDLISK